MSSQLRHLSDAMPRSRPQKVDQLNGCKTCGGSSAIYKKRPYIVMGRNYGDIDEMVACPECAKHCPTCDDIGFVRYDLPFGHEFYGKLFPCPNCPKGRAAAEAAREIVFKGAELPEHYKGLTFATWDGLPAQFRAGKELARAAAGLFVENTHQRHFFSLAAIYEAAGIPMPAQQDMLRNSLVLQGPVGTGKTGLAAAVANVLLENNIRVLYSRARDLIRSVQRRYGSDGGISADDVIEKIKRAPILIIDELNLGVKSDDRKDIMEDVMRHRYGNQLPTIITLNADRDELEGEWGLRTASVVRAMSHWIYVDGTPIRNEGFAVADHWSDR